MRAAPRLPYLLLVLVVAAGQCSATPPEKPPETLKEAIVSQRRLEMAYPMLARKSGTFWSPGPMTLAQVNATFPGAGVSPSAPQERWSDFAFVYLAQVAPIAPRGVPERWSMRSVILLFNQEPSVDSGCRRCLNGLLACYDDCPEEKLVNVVLPVVLASMMMLIAGYIAFQQWHPGRRRALYRRLNQAFDPATGGL